MNYATPSKTLKNILPGTWEIDTKSKELFLTFDDGPIPEVTPEVLSILNSYGIKATFFCVGDNVRKHPDLFNQILEEGHAVGNHTYSHLNGWKTKANEYIEDVAKAELLINSRLFRPPYGKIKPKQARLLKQKGYKIIMWSVLSMDFSKDYSPSNCYDIVVENSKPGSIIVFHDNIKAKENILSILPEMIEYFLKEQYFFSTL